MDEWIYVEDALPKKTGAYLVVVPTLKKGFQFKTVAFFEKGKWYGLPVIFADAVRGWMPLPKNMKKRRNAG